MALDYLAKAREHGRKLGFAGFGLTEVDDRKLEAAIAGMTNVICLDERGQTMSSRAFASWLASQRDQSQSSLTFVIGGADGISQASRDAAHLRIAFGPQTWPHLLVRAMLAEQIFRAMTILTGHPYHRD